MCLKEATTLQEGEKIYSYMATKEENDKSI
jgi:hypothetical protein